MLPGLIGQRDYDVGHTTLMQFFGTMCFSFGGVLLLLTLLSRNTSLIRTVLQVRAWVRSSLATTHR